MPTSPTGKKPKKSAGYDFSNLIDSVENEFDDKSDSSGSGVPNARNIHKQKGVLEVMVDGLDPIDPRIPFSRGFIKAGSKSSGNIKKGKNKNLVRNITKNVKGVFGGIRAKEMERSAIVGLRMSIGNLYKTKVDSFAPSPAETPGLAQSTPEQKSKKQLLREKKEIIKKRAKVGNKDKSVIGMRIEIEKQKKRFPNDKNLTVLSAILTTKDGCLKHRTIEERVSSLYAALHLAGSTVFSDYLTTYSIDTLFGIYFLYLDALKKLLSEKIRKLSASGRPVSPVVMESIRRDIRVIDVLLGQKRLQKTIANIANKLNGFNYPFESMSHMNVARTYAADASQDNDKVGPGTVKLNKFLIKVYLNVFAQIPLFQPLAKNLCDALPSDRSSRVLIANVTMDNAFTQLKIAKTEKEPSPLKQIQSIFNYGKNFAATSIKDGPKSQAEGRVFLRTAEMAEEYAFATKEADPDIIRTGNDFASQALPFFKNEAEAVIRRIYEAAEKRKIQLD